MMRRLILALPALLLAPALTLWADDKKPQPPADQPAAAERQERLKTIQNEFNEKQKEFIQAVQGATTPEARQAAMGKRPDPTPFADRIQKLVEENPADAVAGEGLTWLVQWGKPNKMAANYKLLQQHHLNTPRLGMACQIAGIRGGEDAEKFLRAVVEKSQLTDARGFARYALANILHEQAGSPGAGDKAAALDAEAEKLFEQVVKENADLNSIRGEKLGESAKTTLFEIQHLGIGKVAPEVVSKDLDGKQVKLSDHRGKVVVLDIWATWCGPCRAMIPHEKELVERLKDKPFTLISISGDDKVETLKDFLKETPMPWTHWHNGADGGILKDWNVQYFPTVYVLDPKGVIRFKGVRGKAMDEAVETLLKEMESGKKGAQ
jgi:thiol-disulfide isomerase/thioredoxin